MKMIFHLEVPDGMLNTIGEAYHKNLSLDLANVRINEIIKPFVAGENEILEIGGFVGIVGIEILNDLVTGRKVR